MSELLAGRRRLGRRMRRWLLGRMQNRPFVAHLLLLLLFAVTPLTVMSYLLYAQSRTAYLEQIGKRLGALANEHARATRLLIEQQQDALALLMHDGDIESLLQSGRNVEARAQLDNHRSQTVFVALAIADFDGSYRLNGGDWPAPDTVPQLAELQFDEQGRAWKLQKMSDGSRLLLAQQFDRAGHAMVLLATSRLAPLDRLFGLADDLGESGESFLTDGLGQPLTPLRYNIVRGHAGPEHEAITAQPMRACLRGEHSALRVAPDYAGAPTAMAYLPMANTGCIMVHIRVDEMMRPIERLHLLLLVVLMSMVLAATVVARLVTRRILDHDRQRALALVARRTQAQFRAIYEAIPSALLLVEEGVVAMANPPAERLFGLTGGALRGRPLSELLRYGDAPGWPLPEEADAEGFEVVSAQGKRVPVEAVQSIFPGERRPILLALTDIGERKAAEAQQHYLIGELRRTLDTNIQLLRAIPSILIGVDVAGRINMWNGEAEQVFGMEGRETLNREWRDLAIGWNWQVIDRGLAESRGRKVARLDNVAVELRDGSARVLGLTLCSLQRAGMDNGFLIFGSDITERTKLEQQLHVAQKMEAIGALAAGVAHELNTPLQYVGDNLRFLDGAFSTLLSLYDEAGRQLRAGGEATAASAQRVAEREREEDLEFLRDEVPQALTQSLDGIGKARDIIAAMKEFSHPGQKEMIYIDLNRMLESTATVSRNEWKYVAELELDLDPALPPIKALPELNQVFLNLIVNAAHAIGDKLGKGSSDKGSIRIESRLCGNEARVRICDSGGGIPPEIRKRIFDPFFTTKEVGKGTGQGLAISHDIVTAKLKGRIEVESEDGQGSCFTVALPVEGQS